MYFVALTLLQILGSQKTYKIRSNEFVTAKWTNPEEKLHVELKELNIVTTKKILTWKMTAIRSDSGFIIEPDVQPILDVDEEASIASDESIGMFV